MDTITSISIGTIILLIGLRAGIFLAEHGDPCSCAHCKAHREEEKATRCGSCGGKLTDKESGK